MRKDPVQLRILHPEAENLYSYLLGRRFDPGAEAEAFQPLFELPLISFRGPARLAGALMVTQHPQVQVPFANSISGLGGIIAGTYVLSPLQVPEDSETGN